MLSNAKMQYTHHINNRIHKSHARQSNQPNLRFTSFCSMIIHCDYWLSLGTQIRPQDGWFCFFPLEWLGELLAVHSIQHCTQRVQEEYNVPMCVLHEPQE